MSWRARFFIFWSCVRPFSTLFYFPIDFTIFYSKNSKLHVSFVSDVLFLVHHFIFFPRMSQPIKHRYVTQKFTCAISRPGSLWSLLTLRLGYCAIEMSHEPLKRSTSVGDKRQWIRPDLPSKCTWHLGIDISESPHQHNKTSTK